MLEKMRFSLAKEQNSSKFKLYFIPIHKLKDMILNREKKW